MGQALAAALVLAVLGESAQAYSNFAERLFGRPSQWSQHVDDEAFGDEFKRHEP